ncbi:MAG: ABC1 kinase family protein, partial [Halobacteriaceae archaeon]
ADLRVIRWWLPMLLWFVDDSRAFSLRNLADEFEQTIHEEMDYVRERNMLLSIRSNFADEEGVIIPDTVDSRCGERVLTMEYVPGTKISRVDELDERGIDRRALARRLQRAYLKMIIDDGIFHADPHPGNLAVQSDGTIVFYDFGMSGTVDEFVQDKIIQFYIAVARQEIDQILDALIEMGTLSPNADRATMAEVMELAIRDARGEAVEQYRVQQLVKRVENTIYEFPLRLPANLALVLRVATVVEGVCVTLDEDFDFISVATEYLTERGYREESIRNTIEETRDLITDSSTSMLSIPPKLERALDRVERENLHVRADIEDSNGVIDRLALRVVLGMLLSSALFASALLFAFRPGEYILPTLAIVGAALFAILLYRSFTKQRGIRTTPQFTRYNLRERQTRSDETGSSMHDSSPTGGESLAGNDVQDEQ